METGRHVGPSPIRTGWSAMARHRSRPRLVVSTAVGRDRRRRASNRETTKDREVPEDRRTRRAEIRLCAQSAHSFSSGSDPTWTAPAPHRSRTLTTFRCVDRSRPASERAPRPGSPARLSPSRSLDRRDR